MKKYILISIVEREIGYAYYDSLEDAQNQMKEEFNNSCADADEYIADEMAEIDEMSAWITDGNNHDDYDWWIIDLESGAVLAALITLMKDNQDNINHIDEYEDKSYAKGYAEGVHDGYLDVLNKLGLKLPEEQKHLDNYYN